MFPRRLDVVQPVFEFFLPPPPRDQHCRSDNDADGDPASVAINLDRDQGNK
ncbi:MAG TPA: hypothetical protein VFJ64_03205 [Solirubrobacterales bacterium]|nr:hypothetical protein [Solirubrobacterales bacterium]